MSKTTQTGKSRLPPLPKVSRQNEDAFSSSSDDEEGKGELKKLSSSVSEWDKALRSGSTNTGAASFDNGEFYKEAKEELVREIMNDDEEQKQNSPPQSPVLQRRAQKKTQDQKSGKVSYSSAPPPPPPIKASASITSENTSSTTAGQTTRRPTVEDERLSSGVLPDVLMTMRQKIESLTLFDSDMMKLAEVNGENIDDRMLQETRESLKRSSQQSLSAAVLVSLAHKRYERRRLAAMEIEKVVRSLVLASTNKGESLERVRAILLLLSDDYVRSTSEDARKGGVVALAACAIGLKRAPETVETAEARDLILASVVHACQDNSSRVRYYATESLFNVVKVMPSLAVQHFFILFEILRSLYADVDVDVRSGAELLDKKLKEVIVGAINAGSFTADACVPIFARFVYMRNKATKRLTLTWLQELNEKLIGSPVLDSLHLFLGGIFAMIADPSITIRQSALAFLQSVLPKLVMEQDLFEEEETPIKIDFDKLIQSVVSTLENPDPFVRKVAMFWMYRIVKAHLGTTSYTKSTPASLSVRMSLPHLLPGLLLSIGDTYQRSNSKDSFLPEQTTQSLAQQTNDLLQEAVKRDGKSFASHLDGFIVSLREELDTVGGIIGSRTAPAVERKPYRMDVSADGTGIESAGWFKDPSDRDSRENDAGGMMSRLTALQWVKLLYAHVVPDVLKADYAREFVTPIISLFIHNPPERIVFKGLEVLATITVPVHGETVNTSEQKVSSVIASESKYFGDHPMSKDSISYALDILDSSRGQYQSRNREMFAVLVNLYGNYSTKHHQLLPNLSNVIQYMCTLQPPEFVFVSFAVELDNYISDEEKALSKDLKFVSAFVQQMNHVLLNTNETLDLRVLLHDCMRSKALSEHEKRRTKLFSILFHSFSHNLVSSLSLCLWAGAYRTAALAISKIDPLDIDIIFLLEIDKLVEVLERPTFRDLHLRMIDSDDDPECEGSGRMLFQVLKSLLMILPQSTAYNLLRDRLVTVARFRQSALSSKTSISERRRWKIAKGGAAEHIQKVREQHCTARWNSLRSDSLETRQLEEESKRSYQQEADGTWNLGKRAAKRAANTERQEAPISGNTKKEWMDFWNDQAPTDTSSNQ